MMRYIATFFNSYAGMYMAQSFCHSLVAAIVTDLAMKSWLVVDPLVRQRFRLAVILFPIFSFPVYQLINPERSSPEFRLRALFDVNRWLMLDIGGIFPAGLFFLVLLAATTAVFLFQEMIPVLGQSIAGAPAHEISRIDSDSDSDPFVQAAAGELGIKPPSLLLVDDDEPVLFSTTGAKAAIYLSTALRKSLNEDQLHAALAHEMAHIRRNRHPLLMVVFVLRILMFFNPVVLIKFRQAVRDEEKICDDLAVALTRDPKALAEALEKFHRHAPEQAHSDRQSTAAVANSLEDRGHRLHIASRIKRLQEPPPRPKRSDRTALAAALLVNAVLNYFIV